MQVDPNPGMENILMAAKKSAKRAAKKGGRKAAKKSGRKTAKRGRKTTARKSATKKSARKSSARKGARKVAKKGGRKYGKKATRKIGRVMHEYKEGTLKSGKGGAGGKVKSREQAIAIAISEAREEGDKVPRRRTARKS
ncbi:MAG: DUF6496 domain-containing protein [Gemmatimonas sp.]